MAYVGYPLFSMLPGNYWFIEERLLFGYDGYEVVAQPSIVIVRTTSSKPTLIRLNTFP